MCERKKNICVKCFFLVFLADNINILTSIQFLFLAEAMNTHGRTFAVFLLNRLKPKEKQEKLDIFKMILYDLMVYRQKNAILSPNNRCLFVSYAYELMPPTGQAIGDKLPLYVLMEQTIIRQVCLLD